MHIIAAAQRKPDRVGSEIVCIYENLACGGDRTDDDDDLPTDRHYDQVQLNVCFYRICCNKRYV